MEAREVKKPTIQVWWTNPTDKPITLYLYEDISTTKSSEDIDDDTRPQKTIRGRGHGMAGLLPNRTPVTIAPGETIHESDCRRIDAEIWNVCEDGLRVLPQYWHECGPTAQVIGGVGVQLTREILIPGESKRRPTNIPVASSLLKGPEDYRQARIGAAKAILEAEGMLNQAPIPPITLHKQQEARR